MALLGLYATEADRDSANPTPTAGDTALIVTADDEPVSFMTRYTNGAWEAALDLIYPSDTATIATLNFGTGSSLDDNDSLVLAEQAGAGGFLTPVERQTAGNWAASSSVTLSWDTTAAGSLLVLMIAARAAASITTPTGYALTTAVVTNGNVKVGLYYKANAASQSSVVCAAPSATRITVLAAEYSSVLAVSPLDKEASATGSSTTPSTGTTATTAQTHELWVGAVGSLTSGSLTGETNGFVQAGEVSLSTPSLQAELLMKIVTTTGAANTGGTLAASVDWVGKIATFKCAVGTASPDAIANKAIIYSKDVAGVTKLFYKQSDGTEVGPLT